MCVCISGYTGLDSFIWQKNDLFIASVSLSYKISDWSGAQCQPRTGKSSRSSREKEREWGCVRMEAGKWNLNRILNCERISVTSAMKALFAPLSFCWFVCCLYEGLHINYWMDPHETWWKDGTCVKEDIGIFNESGKFMGVKSMCVHLGAAWLNSRTLSIFYKI